MHLNQFNYSNHRPGTNILFNILSIISKDLKSNHKFKIKEMTQKQNIWQRNLFFENIKNANKFPWIIHNLVNLCYFDKI